MDVDRHPNPDYFFAAADEEHVRRERGKARDLRTSQWWKNERGKGICHYCKKRFPPKELTLDHITPVIRGGRSTKSNCVPCCKVCNARKTYHLPVEMVDMESPARRSASGADNPDDDEVFQGEPDHAEDKRPTEGMANDAGDQHDDRR